MPTVSTFFGIDIIMRFNEKHGPHFHARHAEKEALISILNGEMLSGQLSQRAYRLILEWLALHRTELMVNWERARRHEDLQYIEGLE